MVDKPRVCEAGPCLSSEITTSITNLFSKYRRVGCAPVAFMARCEGTFCWIFDKYRSGWSFCSLEAFRLLRASQGTLARKPVDPVMWRPSRPGKGPTTIAR